MPDHPSLRRATGADGVAVSAIFDAARTANLAFLPILHTRPQDDLFFTAVVTEHEAWVAVDGADRPLAFAVWHDRFLDHLYVDPDAQGTGLGTALLDQVKATHPEGFDLYVFQRNVRARGFYEQRGFRPIRFDAENEEHEPDILERWNGHAARLQPRQPGAWRGRVEIADEFDDLPADLFPGNDPEADR